MATQYSSDRSERSGYGRASSSVQPGISRSSSQRGYSQRPASGSARGYSQRPTSSRTSSGQRTASRTGSSQRRPASGGGRRPPNRNGRRPAPRRNSNAKLIAAIALVAVALVAIIFIVVRPGGRGGDQPVSNPVVNTPTEAPVTLTDVGDAQIQDATGSDAEAGQASQYANIAEMLADSDNMVEGLSESEMVQVDQLAINESLPDNWLNVLLLGTDERHLSDSARTDAIIICSINRDTGEVKLSSIMRDLAVEFTDIGKYNGTYRINAANYFGGPKLAIKTVNQCFDMNIQYYVMVNFFGFGKIAQQLGGVEVDIDETEMKLINERQREQFKFAYKEGINDFDTEQIMLEQYGENIHLNGNQTLAYARIRKTDGGDYKRVTRQQTVLNKLLQKAKKLSAIEMVNLLYSNLDMIKTNMQPDDILSLATKVVGNGLGDIETFRIPQPNTYKEETRENKGMLYDCDWATNALRLYNFIYE